MCTLSAPMLMARPILVTIPDFLGHGIQMLPAEMFLASPWGGSFNVLRFRYDAHRQVRAVHLIAPAYFVFFYIVLVLVVVNIFVAILQDAFTTAHKKQTALKTKQPAVGFPFAAGVWPTVVFYIKRQWVAVKYGAGADAKLAMPSDTKGATPTLGAPCTRTWPWKCKRSVKS
ncbi:hypothetical protein DYB30_002762 [Aphanomyces astaci]|uniref:Ion transport domain-containing protein n=1 Tax=Aphanomyces astaci TaxID=112090 RepID=A0A397E9W8_APHAT|nr:hypothetical protein DYB30_002762 [Aphanomyces astaci]